MGEPLYFQYVINPEIHGYRKKPVAFFQDTVYNSETLKQFVSGFYFSFYFRFMSHVRAFLYIDDAANSPNKVQTT